MKRLLFVGVLLVLCALAFLPGIDGPFFLDDEMNLLRARAPSGQLSDAIDAVVRNGSGLLHRPVSNATFLANYHWIGSTPFHYKVVNLAIHLLNGFLVWLLAARILNLLVPGKTLGSQRGPALVAALIWVAHPLQVSTVLYAVQRMTQLSALFAFAALIVALGALSRFSASGSRLAAYRQALAVFALMGLAVLSKENGALAPLLLLSIVACAPAERLQEWRVSLPHRAFLILVVGLPLIVGVVGVAFMFPGFMRDYDTREFTMAERLLTEPRVMAHYLGTILWPDIRNMGLYLDIFAIQRPNDPLAWLGLIPVLGVAILAFVVRGRAPMLCFAILWFATAHLMESTIIALEIAFEHRNYVAMLGPILALVHYAGKWASRFMTPRQLQLVAVVPLLLLGGITAHRSHIWSSTDLFTLHEAENHPQSSRAMTQAAARDIALGNLAGAAARIRTAQAARPNSFWMMAYDIHLACAGVPVTVDWDELLAQAKRRPDEMGLEAALRPSAELLVRGRCPAVDPQRFDRLLAEMIEALATTTRPALIERLYILRYQLAELRGDDDQATRLLMLGSEANPQGLDALTRMAYLALNNGDLEAAERYASLQEARINRYHRRTRMFQVEELRGFIKQARTASPLAVPDRK